MNNFNDYKFELDNVEFIGEDDLEILLDFIILHDYGTNDLVTIKYHDKIVSCVSATLLEKILRSILIEKSKTAVSLIRRLAVLIKNLHQTEQLTL